jgi:hypothetical protein
MKAWIENEVIRDISNGNPEELYHPDVAKFYTTDVPDDAVNGDGWVNGKLIKPVVVEPVAAEPAAIVPPKLSTVDFRGLFTIAEEIAITKSVDEVVVVLWSRFTDPKLENVDMALASVDYALDYLTTSGILAAGRKAEILLAEIV